jgi:histidyl-tRNA synthetase
VYFVLAGAAAAARGLELAERLRDAVPELRVETDLGGGSFKAQFKRADRSGASVAVVLGDDELGRGVAALKPLRGGGAQEDCALEALPARVARLVAAAPVDDNGAARQDRGRRSTT